MGERVDIARDHRAFGRGEVVGGREPEAALSRVAAEQHDLFDDERERELVLLRQVREVLRECAAIRSARIASEATHAPSTRLDEPGDRAHERGLAGAVGPHHHDEIAGVDVPQ